MEEDKLTEEDKMEQKRAAIKPWWPKDQFGKPMTRDSTYSELVKVSRVEDFDWTIE